MTRRLLGTAAILLLFAPCRGLAEGPPNPEIGYAFPGGGRAGQTVDVRLGLYEWTPDLQYFVHSAGVKLAVLDAAGPLLLQDLPHVLGKKAYDPPPLPREVHARFVIPAETPAGPIRWQVANANGTSRTGLFVVSREREMVEDERRDTAERVGDLPVTVNGRIRKNEEIDRYVVRRNSPGPVTCDLFARRLGSKFHGVIEVHDSRGSLIGDAVDTRGLDVACTFFANAGVDYTVSIRDLDYLGNRSFIYRLAIAAVPRVVAAIPTASRRESGMAVEFIGFGIATGAARLERAKHVVTFPSDPTVGSFDYALDTPFGRAAPVLVDVPTTPVEGAHIPTAPVEGAHVPTAPVGGASERRAADKRTDLVIPDHRTVEFDGPAAHRYQFFAKKGDRLALSASSRVVGAPIDLSLVLFGPDGKEQARNDDLAGTADAGLDVVAPADGLYRVIVSDLSESGRLPHVYHLSLDRQRPDFALEVPQRISLSIGEPTELAVKVNRFGACAAPIRLAIDGLPEGVLAPRAVNELTVPPDKTEWKIRLTSDKKAPAVAATARVKGTATIDGREVTRVALAPAADNLAAPRPAEVAIPQILVTSTMKPRVRIWPVESDERTVNRGTVHLALLGIERLEGYDGDVLLQLESRQPNKFRQGVSGPDIVVPRGQTRVLYPCFVSEESETVDAYRVSVDALVRVRDPRGNERWLVSNMPSTVSVALTVEGGLMKLSSDVRFVQCRAGQTAGIPVHVLRSPRVPQPVTVRVVAPANLSHALSSESIVVPADRETATVTLHLIDGRLPAGWHDLTLQAIALQPAELPRLADALHATPLEPELLKLLSRGQLPVISEAGVRLQVIGN